MELENALYLSDAYLRRFDAKVAEVLPDGVRLDRTAFYPTGGGQPSDRGKFTTTDGGTMEVVDVRKTTGGIVHHLAGGKTLTSGESVVGESTGTGGMPTCATTRRCTS